MSILSQQPLFLKLESLTLPRPTLLECHSLSFSPQTVAAAILKGCSKAEIKRYLQSYDRGLVENQISDNILERHSAIFYAARSMCNIDMSKIQSPASLLGSTLGYRRCEGGSPLNNYLASHAAERCVVFLDEFDKTNQAVRQSLLTILDSG
jgi:ATP-dependent Clp protease ATP-binding subunit ClpA